MYNQDISFCEFGEMNDTQYTGMKKNQWVKYRNNIKATQAVKYSNGNKAKKKDWMMMSEYFCDAYYADDLD